MVEKTDAHVEVDALRTHLRGNRLDGVGEPGVGAAVRRNDQWRTQAWIPHSTLAVPVQRPARPVPRRVHGAQPIEP